MGRTLETMMTAYSAEEQQEIRDMADEMLLEVRLHSLREEMEISQAELAQALGITQPSVVAMEKRGNDVKLSTMKRYVEAMGGKVSVNVELPGGKHIGFNL